MSHRMDTHTKKCFRYEYKTVHSEIQYRQVNKSYNEKVSIPCNSHHKVFSYYQHKTEPQTSYIKYKPYPKCTVSTTLGGLIGGGIAASLSKRCLWMEYPFGAVLGAGIEIPV